MCKGNAEATTVDLSTLLLHRFCCDHQCTTPDCRPVELNQLSFNAGCELPIEQAIVKLRSAVNV